VGRPLKPIDAEQVYKLARLGCTQEEVGDYFGCARSVISERFRQEFELGRAASKISLRRWQRKKAQAGCSTMLIHLGKAELGQTDRLDITSQGDSVKTVMHFEDNGFGSGGDPGAGGASA
jgi:hypothetical protein